jgi:hypothetical protein
MASDRWTLSLRLSEAQHVDVALLEPDLLGRAVEDVREQVAQDVLRDLFRWRLADGVRAQMRLTGREKGGPLRVDVFDAPALPRKLAVSHTVALHVNRSRRLRLVALAHKT